MSVSVEENRIASQDAPSSLPRTAHKNTTPVIDDVVPPEPQRLPAMPNANPPGAAEPWLDPALEPAPPAPPPSVPANAPSFSTVSGLDSSQLLFSVTNNNRGSNRKEKRRVRGRPPWTPPDIEAFLETKLPEYQRECTTNQTKSQVFYTEVTKEMLGKFGWGVFFVDMVSQGVPLKRKSEQREYPSFLKRKTTYLHL